MHGNLCNIYMTICTGFPLLYIILKNHTIYILYHIYIHYTIYIYIYIVMWVWGWKINSIYKYYDNILLSQYLTEWTLLSAQFPVPQGMLHSTHPHIFTLSLRPCQCPEIVFERIVSLLELESHKGKIPDPQLQQKTGIFTRGQICLEDFVRIILILSFQDFPFHL